MMKDVVLVEGVIHAFMRDDTTEYYVKRNALGCWVHLSGQQIVNLIRADLKASDLSKLDNQNVIKSLVKVCNPFGEMVESGVE